ncbi:MAG: acetylxylan esterase [Thermoleophilia bacterium]|nr:acetylxylan esterase [Thermoleophilia bacterium]
MENTVPSWDGTPIDVNVGFPDSSEFGDGPYPMATYFHGFGGGKEGLNGDLQRFLDQGIAVFSMTERGFRFSCGQSNAITALDADTAGACDDGFIHLMDTRYEVRDAQYLVSLLADEDVILPKKVGSVGASYGGAKPVNQVEVKTQVCPYSEPSGGPYTAPNWAAMSKGELLLKDTGSHVIESDAGSNDNAVSFSTLNPGCTQVAEDHEPGTVEFDFGTVPAGGLTLMGAPTMIADVSVANGAESQIAARLLEISTDGLERIIARGLYRPDASGAQVIQLHGNAYKFEQGTKIRLQLLPKDGLPGVPLGSYARPSNDQRDVTIKNAEIRLPVKEAPGAAGGMVTTTSPKILPAGAELAGDYSGVGSIPISEWNRVDLPTDIGLISVKGPLRAKGKSVKVKISCAAKYDECKPGKSKTVAIKMNNKARKLFRNHLVGPKGGPKRRVKGVKKLRVQVAIYSGKNRAGLKTVIKRVGRVK